MMWCSLLRSDYTPSYYQNGSDSSPPTSIEHFSFSDLPNLDFGSPDEDEGEREGGREGELYLYEC